MSVAESAQRRSGLKWTARVAFVFAITALSWFSLPTAVIAISATILVALQARASTLIEVSFGPLRAKLEREVTEAEKLVEKLREFAGLQAKAVISASTRVGRWGGAGEWAYDSVREMEQALRELGVSEDSLREARRDFVKFVVSDAGFSALGTNEMPRGLAPEGQTEWRAIRDKGLEKSPDEIEAFLRKWRALTPERERLIDDMRWMLEHHDIRDRDQFIRAQTPVEWT